MNNFDIDAGFGQIAESASRGECKVKEFPGFCLLFCRDRSFVKLALDIPSGIQRLEMPWRNHLENDAVALLSYCVI